MDTNELMARVAIKHPTLASRAEKAKNIIVVAIMPHYAVVKSQSCDDENYIVWLDSYKCNCTDYTTGQAPAVGGKKFCKHGLKVAAKIYSEKGETKMCYTMIAKLSRQGHKFVLNEFDNVVELSRQQAQAYVAEMKEAGYLVPVSERDFTLYAPRFWSVRIERTSATPPLGVMATSKEDVF